MLEPVAISPAIPALAPARAYLWSAVAGAYVPVPAAGFALHAIPETDPRLNPLSRAQRVEVAASSPYLLYAPDFVLAAPDRHRGAIAIALDAATAWHDGAPDLWFEGKAYAFAREAAVPHHAWLADDANGRAVWLTYDGASLHHLVDVQLAGDGRLVIDLVRVAG